MRHIKNIAFIIALILYDGLSFAAPKSSYDIENNVEEIIDKILKKHINSDQYLAIITVKDIEPDKNQEEQLFPFSSINVNTKTLKENTNEEDEIYTRPISIEILFDESVNQEKQKIISDKIKKSLRLNDKDRTLKLTKTNLSPRSAKNDQTTSEISSLKVSIESSKMEAEKSKLELEREKSDFAKRELDIKNELLEAKKIKKDPDKTILDWLKDFQLAILASILGLSILVLSFLGSLAFRSSSNTISEAMIKVGTTIASKSDSSSAFSSTPTAAEASTQAKTSAEANSDALPIDSKVENFLTLVEEKIEVLSTEGNFDFYKNFVDMAEKNTLYAASILLALKGEFAKKLLTNISPEIIEKITQYLAEPEGLTQAKKARRVALEQFYASIAMDEFLESPLMQVKNMGWLTKLSTQELIDLAIQLDKIDRTQFLACFSPSRLSFLIEKSKDEETKNKLIDCIVDIDGVTVNDVENLFKKVQEIYDQKSKEDSDRVRKLVDGPLYVAKVMESLKQEDRNRLIERLQQRTELMSAMRAYYIPFDSIKSLTTRNIEDIFSKRPVQQIAMALFATTEDVRASVYDAISEISRETVKEELEAMIGDKPSARRFELQSHKIQQEICRYMLLLNKDGLLEYKEEGAST